MNYTALSLAQTPPLRVPAPFFIAAPLFAAAAAVVLLVTGPEALLTRWSPGLLAATHLLTLGFLALVMFGALQQLLPVLAGVTLARPALFSGLVLASTSLGTAALAAGFLTGQAALFQVAVGALGGGVLLFAGGAGWALRRARSGHATVRAMALALAALMVTAGLGLHLGGGYGWGTGVARALTDLHLTWGLFGWVLILVSGVAYQVVPMFQITPDYPRPLQRWLGPLLAAALLLASAPLDEAALAGGALVGGAALLFGVQTLRLQQRRRRRLPDVTLDYWRLGMGALIAASLLWLALPWAGGGRVTTMVGVLFILGFAVSVVNGMLYKIISFLVWLHLNNRLQSSGRGLAEIPNMKQVIPAVRMRGQFWLHGLALALTVAAVVWPLLTRPAALALLGSSLWLSWNLGSALLLYRSHLRGASG